MHGAASAVVGGYQLDALIGRGAGSEVWRAHRVDGTGGPVAVKRARGSLRAEAAVLAELDHPNVVRLLDSVADGHDVALVITLAGGGSLDDLVARRVHLTPGEVVAVLAPVADALGHAHRRSVVHGDVKPANVLFTNAGVPLLSDFGAARRPAAGIPVVGSAAYLDPHLLATGIVDPRNDIYSLAVVGYLALTGELPHSGATDDDVLDAARRGEHASLLDRPDVPPALAAVVEAALAVDPEDRPLAAEHLAAALRASVPAATIELPAAGEAGSVSRPAVVGGQTRDFGPRPVRPRPEPATAGRRPVALVAAVAVALALAGLLASVVATIVGRRGAPTVQPSAMIDLERGSSTACPHLDAIPVPTSGRELRADLGGEGCEVQVVWDGEIMQLRLDGADQAPRRYDFKTAGADPRPGDLLLGDWDCDGTASPAFYDPTTGRVHYFGAIPPSGELPATDLDATGIPDGRARVVRDGGSGNVCDRVEVHP